MRPPDQVQKLYSKRAAFYQRFFIDFLGWGRELEIFFRGTGYLHHDSRVLDAGCGTGIVTRTLYKIAREKGYGAAKFQAFDLTHNMLEIFREWVEQNQAENIELKQANVLEIESLPSNWREYDLIISAAMFEYLRGDEVKAALSNLKYLLKNGGILLIIVTRRNMVTRWLAGKWWKTNLFDESEIQPLFEDLGFRKIEFRDFSPRWSNFIMVIEAKK